jgi:hypothetical protein
MGRPLNKKYFGNRNLGTTGTGDDGIGGSRVASVTIDTPGSYAGAASPTVSFSAPDLAGVGAVTATGTVVMEALSAVATVNGNGYNVGDVLTVSYGGQTATFTVATLTGGAGSGVATVTPLARGTFTATTVGDKATTVAPAGGTFATLTITYRVKSVTMTENGSGYSSVADAAPTFDSGAAAGTSVLEADSGIQGELGNNENAIKCFAFVTGGSRKIGDIIKQVSTDRYKVETADGEMICQLVTDGVANAAGEMDITVVDTAGKTYYVSKITAHRATLVQYGAAGHVFSTGESAAWSFDAAATGYVQIANA